MKRILFPVALAVILLAGTASAQIIMQRQVIGSGATVATGSVVMHATVGQAIIGRVDNSSNIAWQGFWTPVREIAAVTFVTNEAAGRMQIVGANPTTVETDVAVTLPRATEGRLMLVDALGRVVRPIAEGRLEAGRTLHHLTVTDLSPGRYSLVLEADGERSSAPLVVVR